MKIELHNIPVRELLQGYVNNGEDGVRGYGGRLDIRPPYQRNFIYNDAQQKAVIKTISQGFPLNVMYWVVRADGNFEVMDGQQRTISVGDYVKGGYAVGSRYFHNLTDEEKAQIMDYELTVYFCEGTAREKLDWFEVVNIAGEKLTAQERRNAVYAGAFVSDARRRFSQRNCAAFQFASDYLVGDPIRQEYLETALKWGAQKEICDDIAEYMARHQHDPNAEGLWEHFRNIINWTKTVFPTYHKEMKGVDWGTLYHDHHNDVINPVQMDAEVTRLMADYDVSAKKGIFAYLLTGEEKFLSIRKFDERTKKSVYVQQKKKCALCGKNIRWEEAEADHITPWSKGGKTVIENCQILCKKCNRKKSGK